MAVRRIQQPHLNTAATATSPVTQTMQVVNAAIVPAALRHAMKGSAIATTKSLTDVKRISALSTTAAAAELCAASTTAHLPAIAEHVPLLLAMVHSTIAMQTMQTDAKRISVATSVTAVLAAFSVQTPTEQPPAQLALVPRAVMHCGGHAIATQPTDVKRRLPLSQIVEHVVRSAHSTAP